MMTMRNYPEAIATAAEKVAEIDLAITQAKRLLHEIESEIDQEIACESNLKNELQRKAARSIAIAAHPDHRKLLQAMDNNTFNKAVAAAELERLRGEFAILKLEAKERISDKMRSLENGDLVAVSLT
jgi:hypothetical protein